MKNFTVMGMTIRKIKNSVDKSHNKVYDIVKHMDTCVGHQTLVDDIISYNQKAMTGTSTNRNLHTERRRM